MHPGWRRGGAAVQMGDARLVHRSSVSQGPRARPRRAGTFGAGERRFHQDHAIIPALQFLSRIAPASVRPAVRAVVVGANRLPRGEGRRRRQTGCGVQEAVGHGGRSTRQAET